MLIIWQNVKAVGLLSFTATLVNLATAESHWISVWRERHVCDNKLC